MHSSYIRLALALLVAAAILAPSVGLSALAAYGPDDPVTAENPRVWPAVERSAPMSLGAIEAFRAPERASEAGVQWSRVLFDWSAIQRNGSHEWQLGWLDTANLRAEREAGRPVVGVLMSTPSWASGTTDAKSPPRGLDLPVTDPGNVWATWVRSLAARYDGVVDTWVVWNEPDVWNDENNSRQWDGTPEEYFQLLKTAYVAAKQGNPRATVLMAGMTYWWDQQYGREQYFSRVLRAAAADPTSAANGWYFDGAVLQLYNNPRGLFDAPATYRQIMRRFGINKPVWVNETNAVPWDDPAAPLTRDHFRVTQDEQATYLVQAIAYAFAGGVERLAVYKMVDDGPLRRGIEQGFGLVRDDPSRSPRPVFETFKVLARELAPTTRAQLVDEGAVSRVYLEQPSLGRRLTVLWSNVPSRQRVLFRTLGRTASAMDKFGATRPLEVDEGGLVDLALEPATANTIPGYPDAYFVGGTPVFVVEPMPADYQPYQVTSWNLPPDFMGDLSGEDVTPHSRSLPSWRPFRL